jgi:hypothetical protein
MSIIDNIREMRVVLLVFIVLTIAALPLKSQNERPLKPRGIILTDLKRVQETDDYQSLVRLLAFADLVEIEGIIISSGFNYWKPEHIEEGYELIWELIDAYGESVNNLMKMNGQSGFKMHEEKQQLGYWPSKNYLIRTVAYGTPLVGLDKVGDDKSSEGSQLIEKIIDQLDDRPVYILAWGGANVLSQTLWDIAENPLKKRSNVGITKFIEKIRVVSIGDQDGDWNRRSNPDQANNSHFWMREQFPEMFWLKISANPFAKISNTMQDFYQRHIQGHGALGNAYPDHSNSVEGDSPSLWYVLPLGYGNPEEPWKGSIIGTYINNENGALPKFYVQTKPLIESNQALVEQQTIPFWNAFAARMDWARSGTGNRPPVIIIKSYNPNNLENLTCEAGEEIWIDASGTYDRESDKLTFDWQLVSSPENPIDGVKLKPDSKKVNVFIPRSLKGKTIYLMLQVTDDGAGHHLSTYQSIAIDIH